MDIYHSTYTQYIDLMNQLKGNVEDLISQSFDERQKADGVVAIIEQIDNTIDTASEETFLPTNELLGNTKQRMGVKTPAAQVMLKQCFRTLNMAAVSLQRITDDCALMEANELSEQEM